jgi:hypothetical protein
MMGAIAILTRLQSRRLIVVRFTAEETGFCLLQNDKIGSGSHTASHSVDGGNFHAGDKAAGGLELVTHLQLVQSLRISRAIRPRPHTPSWNAQGQLHV